MKKYSFEIQLLVSKDATGEKDMGEFIIDTSNREVVTKLYLQEIPCVLIDDSYENAKNRALIYAHECIRTLAKEGRFSAFYLACDNRGGVSI